MLKLLTLLLTILLNLCVPWHPKIADLYLWSLNVTCIVQNPDIFYEFVKQHKLVVFAPHPYPFDHVCLLSAFRVILSFVALRKYMLFPISILAKRFQCIIVGNKDAARQIAERILIQNSPPIVIAPTAGLLLEDESVLANFKTGAFIHNEPILPVVLHYSSTEDFWRTGSVFSVLLRRCMQNKRLICTVHVLDPVYPPANTPAVDFAKLVRIKMQCVLDKQKNDNLR